MQGSRKAKGCWMIKPEWMQVGTKEVPNHSTIFEREIDRLQCTPGLEYPALFIDHRIAEQVQVIARLTGDDVVQPRKREGRKQVVITNDDPITAGSMLHEEVPVARFAEILRLWHEHQPTVTTEM